MLDAAHSLVNRLALAALLLAPWAALAHDIPADVNVNAYLRPQGQRLLLLARVPLKAMREVDYPRRGPGVVDLARVDVALRNAATLWLERNIEIHEGEVKLAAPAIAETRLSLDSDTSFRAWETALAHVTGPRLPPATQVFWEQGLLDVLFEYPIASEDSAFSIRPRLDRLGLQVQVALRFLPPGGGVRAFEFHADPGLVRLDPRWHEAALRFVVSGFWHILEGGDHLLFLLCLVIPLRRFVPLAVVITAFTLAHSITLIASAYGMAPDAQWFPPLVELLIAMSIFYMAIENALGRGLNRRWVIAFAFGLVHGFGFAFALREQLQFAGAHLLASLLAFNVGVELGQLLALAAMVPLLWLLFRFVVAERAGTILLSLLVGHTAWHWMGERGERLSRFPWPEVGAAELAAATRWTMAFVALAALLWLGSVFLRRRSATPAPVKEPPERE